MRVGREESLCVEVQGKGERRAIHGGQGRGCAEIKNAGVLVG